MAELQWDLTGQRIFETGVDHGVLYIPDNDGDYTDGVAWNGLINVSESPSGAEASPLYADNIKYLNLISAEEFGATIEAYTYPPEFNQFDGLAVPTTGVAIGQQNRKAFGFSYRTRIGNDLEGDNFGYKLHLVYGASAAPSEKAYSTVNDSPEAVTFSWEVTTVPVPVTGMRPTATITIDSTQVDADALATLEEILYGTPGNEPMLPFPDEVIAIFAGSQTEVIALNPTFVSATGVITIPTVTGVTYRRGDTNAVVTGTVTIGTPGASLAIEAEATSTAYILSPEGDDDWIFTRDD